MTLCTDLKEKTDRLARACGDFSNKLDRKKEIYLADIEDFYVELDKFVDTIDDVLDSGDFLA